jgi:hypothetical protein
MRPHSACLSLVYYWKQPNRFYDLAFYGEGLIMSTGTAREIVIIQRGLRNGATTEERVERWLAEIIVGRIVHDEPHVARALIVSLQADEYRQRHYPAKRVEREQAYQRALQFAEAAFGVNWSATHAPLVA